MTGLLKVAEHLLIDRLISNDAPLTGKTKAGLSLATLSGLLLVTGSGFIVYGLYLYFNANYTPDLAAIMTGGTIMFLGVCAAVLAFIGLQIRRWKIQKTKDEIIQLIETTLETLDDEVGDTIRENPKTAITAATAAGFAAGQRFL